MKCPRCKGEGRVVGGTNWVRCEVCAGKGEVEGTPPAVPPTLAQVTAAGYSNEAAAAIVSIEQRKFEAGEKPYGPNDPLPWSVPETTVTLAQQPKPTTQIAVGSSVKGKTNGQVMTVTALMGDGEIACEWDQETELPDGKKVTAKNSGVFNTASVDLIPA